MWPTGLHCQTSVAKRFSHVMYITHLPPLTDRVLILALDILSYTSN